MRPPRVPLRSVLFFVSGFLASIVFNYLTSRWFSLNVFHQEARFNPSSPDDPAMHAAFDKLVDESDRMVKSWNDTMEHTHLGEDIIAQALARKVRVLCWIMTNPDNHEKKAVHIKATWAKRCNKYIFMSTKDDPNLPSIKLPVKEGRNALWSKTRETFIYLHKHYLNDYDFFMKADDDTYVIVENLRRLLRDVSPNEPIYFGRHFRPIVKQGYMSGGGGYVLTRESVRRLVEIGFDRTNPKCTLDYTGPEDAHVGECLQNVGVRAGDSRDSLGRERFHPLGPGYHLGRHIDKGFWLWHYNFWPLKVGPECCSDFSITFHYISPDQLYELEFYIYHLTPYGIVRDFHHAQQLIRSLEKLGYNGEQKFHHHDEKKLALETAKHIPQGQSIETKIVKDDAPKKDTVESPEKSKESKDNEPKKDTVESPEKSKDNEPKKSGEIHKGSSDEKVISKEDKKSEAKLKKPVKENVEASKNEEAKHSKEDSKEKSKSNEESAKEEKQKKDTVN